MVGFVKFVMALVFIDATSIFGSQLDAHVDLDKPVIDAPLEPKNRTFSRRMLDQLQSTQGTIIRTNMTTKICYDCQIKFWPQLHERWGAVQRYVQRLWRSRAVDHVSS